MNATKENDYTCGTCKYWNCDEDYCMASGNHEMYEQDTCEYWTDPDEPDLTEDEKAEIAGDKEAHRIIVEGREIE